MKRISAEKKSSVPVAKIYLEDAPVPEDTVSVGDDG